MVEPNALGPRAIDIASLETFEDYGYSGGRDSFRTFCERVFAPGGPRFLRDGDALVMFRHADVRSIGVHPQLSTLAPNVMFPGVLNVPAPDPGRVGFAIADLIKNQLFSSNPPLNPALRRVLLNQIGPKQTAAYADRTRAVASELLNAVPAGAEIDLVQDVAEPLTGRFWGALIGMPDEEAVAAAVAARRMTPMLYLRQTAESLAAADSAARAYRSLVEGGALRSLARGGCPFVDQVAKDLATIDIEDDLDYGGYVPKTAGAFLAGNLFDGFHTAALAAANTLYALLSHPAALEQVERSPEMAAAAVAESLRLESPVIHLNRIATEDIVEDDIVIPKGTRVIVMWGAANHDPAAFPDPEVFDIARPQQGATTFGGGAHICPGRFVAALISRCLVEALIETRTKLTIVPGKAQWIGNNAMSQLARLPATLGRRGG
jgi:cytochrome P450